ncbi:MAG: hypothetical protein AAF602_12675 [Myxococcota bacterium]
MALLSLLVACGSGSVWEKASVPFDPECGSCSELGSGELGHLGDVRVLVDTQTNDAEAQWTTCVGSLMNCLSAFEPIRDCVAAAQCPTTCTRDFDREARGAGTDEDLLEAIDAVYFAEDAVCGTPGDAP